jgi:hypothetical protein
MLRLTGRQQSRTSKRRSGRLSQEIGTSKSIFRSGSSLYMSRMPRWAEYMIPKREKLTGRVGLRPESGIVHRNVEQAQFKATVWSRLLLSIIRLLSYLINYGNSRIFSEFYQLLPVFCITVTSAVPIVLFASRSSEDIDSRSASRNKRKVVQK